MVNKGVDWKFITERASWMGASCTDSKALHEESNRTFIFEFRGTDTLVTEVKAVVNERLLTYVYDDLEGVAYPLTPAQLIYGRNLATFNGKHFEICSTNETLTRVLNITNSCYDNLLPAGRQSICEVCKRLREMKDKISQISMLETL